MNKAMNYLCENFLCELMSLSIFVLRECEIQHVQASTDQREKEQIEENNLIYQVIVFLLC